jgi:hypothetical protein
MTNTLIMAEASNFLLRMLLASIRSYLKSVLKYTFLILETHHPETLYLRQQEWDDPCLNSKAKIIRKQKSMRNNALSCSCS